MKKRSWLVTAGGVLFLFFQALAACSQPGERIPEFDSLEVQKAVYSETASPQPSDTVTITSTPSPTPTATTTYTPSPSTTPTPSHTPQPTDTPQPTFTVTVPPPASGFILLSISEKVKTGEQAEAAIRTQPGTECRLAYVTPSGTKSTARGLGAITADSDGICSWKWMIGTRTRPGTGKVTISAGGQTSTYPLEIIKP